MIIYRFAFTIFSLLFMFSCGGNGNSGSSSQPKDLNFSEISNVDEFSEKVKLSITSRRSSSLIGEFPADHTIDARAFKHTVNSYAQAISQKDWVLDHLDMKQDGNKFSKSFRWLDKRHRMAMTIVVNLTKQGNNIKLQTVEFDTNIEVLEKITY